MKTINDNIKPILALLIVLLAFGYFFAILIIQDKVDPQVIIAIVSLSSAATGYYFGSASGAAKKDDIIGSIATSTAQPTVTQTGDQPQVTVNPGAQTDISTNS